MMGILEFKKNGNENEAGVLEFEFDEEEAEKQISLVSSADVSAVCGVVLENFGDENLKEVLNQEYNLTCGENITLKSMHKIIFNHLKKKNLEFQEIWTKNELSKNTYPSVHCGPISNQKSIQKFTDLGYTPTSTSKSLKNCVDFFKSVMKFKYKNSKIEISSPYEDQLATVIDKLSKTQRRVFKLPFK
mmetsp:Transcript_21954/g.19504  ORF Transcript_21954/g.19504 Transcript_21954/m.19504 type:complete len:188 (+) Transcript_21954:831-1394(+)